MGEDFRKEEIILKPFLHKNFRKILEEGSIGELIEVVMLYLKSITKSDYVGIVVWDNGRKRFYLTKFLGEDIKIPPAKPGKGPLGICMLKGMPIKGIYGEFDGGDAKLKEIIGPVMCIPLAIPEKSMMGAIGLGRKKGSSFYSGWEDRHLKLVGNLVSPIIATKVLQDLLAKERIVVSALYQLLSSLMEERNEYKRYDTFISKAIKMFDADFAFWGKVDKVKKLVVPVIAYGFKKTAPIPFGKGVAGSVAQRGDLLVFKFYPLDKLPEGYDEEEARTVGSIISVPVFVGDNIEAVITLARVKGKPLFSESDVLTFLLFQRVLNLLLSFMKYEEERENIIKLRGRIQRLESLGVLMGAIAHDFNNILNVVMGFAQIGRETAESSKVKEYFDIIYNQCKTAARLTSDILTLSKEPRLQKRLIDLRVVVKEVVELVKKSMATAIDVIYEDDGSDHYFVVGDPAYVHTMLMNLAINARDAMPHGGKLTFRLRRFERGKELGFKVKFAVVLEVEDTGEGIEPEHIDKIFDPFFTTKGMGKGTGLGLAQVHKVITDMGGLIDVRSELGKGTKFIIYIPEAEHLDEGLFSETVDMRDYKVETKDKALVVDDNIELVELIKGMLESMNMEAFVAFNANEAKSIFESFGNEIGLLITDLVMPEVSGLELAKNLLKQKRNLKVIFITGYTSKVEELSDFIRESGAVVITKPFNIRELVETVRKLYGES